MEIRNSLIVTNDKSVLRLRVDEVRHFSNNLVIHEDTLNAWLSDPEGWEVPVSPSDDVYPAPADAARASVHKKVGA